MNTCLVDYSISLLRHGEPLALSLNPDGYWVAFSGGKDSQVLLELCKMAGVKFRAYYNVTSNDPPDNVYFIRRHYPEVTFVHPMRNFFKLVEVKGLPTIYRRFCCERLKEGSGAGFVVLTGVRREESVKRSKYEEVAVFSRRKEHRGRHGYSIDAMLEAEHQCIRGKDRVMIRPILGWSQLDVWEFVRERGLPVNPCYAKFDRVGCMFCPFSNKKQLDFYEREYPGFHRLFLKSLQIYIDKRDLRTPEYDAPFSTAIEYYDWWKSGKKLSVYLAEKRQLSLYL